MFMNQTPVSKHYFPLIEHTTDLLPIQIAYFCTIQQRISKEELCALDHSGTVHITSSTSTDNKALFGGVMYTSESLLSIINSSFTNSSWGIFP